jgi:flagellar hook assembly protein FlgD
LPSARFVRRLVNDHQPAGDYRTTWDGQDDSGLAVASGVYLLRLRTGGSLQTRRLTLLK